MVISQKEQGLRRRIGTDKLIGCYTIAPDGSGMFNDIRGEQGDCVSLQTNGGLSIPYSGMKLLEGAFYSFAWHLDDDEIVMDGQPEPVDNDDFLQKLFNAKLSLSGSNLELTNNFQRTIFDEVTGAQHTYIYELLQNANDYPFGGERVSVNFIVTDNYLFFTHTGAPFNLRNVVGITSINQGEKKKNVDTIGYKGIGFKTVFVNNEYVYLRSGGWSFRFDKAFSEEQFAGECPWALMPVPTQEQELDAEVVETLSHLPSNMRVQFAMRHKTNAKANIPQLDKVFSDNQILLFIPNIGSVDVIAGGKKLYHVEKDESRWSVRDYHYPIPPSLRQWVGDNIDNGNKVPEKFKNITKVRISFAVNKDGNKIIPVESARVYNYLPTELRLGFGFLINADFIPNGSRSGLHDVEWNNHVMQQAGVYFAEWWASFMDNEGEYDLNSVFDILPDLTSNDHYGKIFLKGFFNRITQIPCVPALKNGKYKVCRLDEILQDRIAFFAQPETIISDEDFYKYYKTRLYLPHPEIRDNKNYKALIDKFGPTENRFNVLGLERLVNNSQFCEWLKTRKNNIRFNGFLISSTYIKELISRATFLRNDRRLGTASKLYEDIDRYMVDLDFLDDLLPRIDEEVRQGLSHYANWDTFSKSFMPFDANSFARMVLEDFGKYRAWFEGIDESVKFIHFLVTTHYQGGLPDKYPMFNQDGKQVIVKSNLYQKDKTGTDFAARSWIDGEWLQFINDRYLEKDGERVSKFLSSLKIGFLTPHDTYTRFINEKTRIPYIAQAIKEKEASMDFYRYLWSIQNITPFFSSEMRGAYTILSTDGENKEWVPINHTIFKQDEDWKEIIEKSWMPSCRCWAIDDIYYENLKKEEREKFQSFLEIKQVVHGFTVPQLFNLFSINKCFSAIFERIDSIEISKDFLAFLWEYKKATYKTMQKGELSGLPVATMDSTQLTPISQVNKVLFFPNDEVLSLYYQTWFDKNSITILSTEYEPIFNSGEKRAFFSSLGFKRFKTLSYVRQSVLPKLDEIRAQIIDKDSNLAFHRFFSSIHAELSENEAKPLAKMPIYISSPDNPDGVLSDHSDDHYLPSPFLSEIISKDLVPIEILDSVHPDYLQSTDNEKYLVSKLSNIGIDSVGFIDYIVKRAETVAEYLKDAKRNIAFWKWVLANMSDNQVLSGLKKLPVLTESGEYLNPDALFISNNYVDTDIEKFVNQFVSGATFISSAYLDDEEENTEWLRMFSAIGVKVSTEDILFKDVLPNLKYFKERFIVLELAKYVDLIKSRIHAKDAKMIEHLSQTQLLCDDGMYRRPKDVVVTGKYFDIEKETYPDIRINNLVSTAYISDCGENHNLRRQIMELMKTFGDTFKAKCENSTQLRNKKLEYFAHHQSQYATDDSHYRIISELAADYRIDSVGISDLLNHLPEIKLIDKDGMLRKSERLYFGSSFNPPCDFEGNGIRELKYVSDEYNNTATNCYRLLHFLGVKDSFKKDNIPLLHNYEFAVYFWTHYAPYKQDELGHFCDYDHLFLAHCIPSSDGVKRPCDLYHTANSRLNKIVEQLPNGKGKQPCINLPEWLNVGLRRRLFIGDSLDYLKIETLDYRQDVLGWLFETPEAMILSHQCEISDFLKVATWYTGKKTWAPLRNLVALEWADGSSALKDSFGGNAFVCNPSNMPETKMVYDKICTIFGIKILTERDFIKKKSGNCIIDDKARNEIDKRLLYIAYKIDKKNWKSRYNKFHSQLFKVDLEKCESILYYYNENINSDDIYSYIENPTTLWYVGEWDGKRFDKILEWILNTFQLKKYGFTKSSLEKMFEMSVNKYLLKYEAGAMPAEFLAMLAEADKAGIEIDQNARYEEGVGEDDDALIEENFNGNVHGYTDNSNLPVEDATSKAENNEALKERTRQRQHKQRTRTTEITSPVERSHPSEPASANRNDSKNDTLLENRMQKKWEAQRRKDVSRPQGAGFRPKEELWNNDLKGKAENKSENPNFFSGKNWASNRPADTSSSRDKPAEDMQRRQMEAENSAVKAKEQYNLFEIWQRTKPYSFKWFKYLMELQFQETDKRLPAPVQIDFHAWTTINENQNILRIISPSRNIPKWLEDAQDVKVTLLGSSSRRLECAITSVDGEGMELLIQPGDLSIINKADKIRVNAQNHTNFIDSLQTSFLKLDYDDDFQLDENLTDEIKFIYGPPGTGKTTRLVEILSELIYNAGAHRLNVLVLTPTNKAADVISEKLFDNPICHDAVVRFGYTDCSKLMSGDASCFQNRDTMDLDDRDDNIIVTTIARYAYDTIQPDNVPISEIPWDYIVVDEASMIDIVPITYLLQKGSESKFIIAGDPKQITPIPQHNMPAYNIYNMVGLDSLKDAMRGNHRFPIEALTVQHRSIPVIGNLISDFCYQSIVKNDANRVKPKPLSLDGVRIKHLNFLGFKIQEMDLLYELSQINDSAIHLYSAIFAYNMVEYMVKQIALKYDTPYSIGIVCPYKAQAEAIQQMLENRPLTNNQCDIVCGTVHKFQGDECDIMLLVLNPPPKTYNGSHINNENIINVAMSRARDYIFFLMPEKDEDGYHIKDRLGSIIDIKNRSIHFCGDIEKAIFGNPNYIYENSSIQCHQSVNVFYDNRAKYEIRLSDTALDIQIND